MSTSHANNDIVACRANLQVRQAGSLALHAARREARRAEDAIVPGYYQHIPYTASEHRCTLVAAAFENQVMDFIEFLDLL